MRLAHIFPSRPAFLGLSCLVGALLLAACSSSPPTAYYALDLQKPSSQEPKSLSSAEPVIVVLPTDVPEMVDRSQIVTRDGENRVLVSDSHRWAAPLRHEISRVVAAELSDRLGSSGVITLPYAPDNPMPDYRLKIIVQRLDLQSGHGVLLDAAWIITARDGVERRGRETLEEPVSPSASDVYAALAAAQTKALRRLADNIANSIAKPRR